MPCLTVRPALVKRWPFWAQVGGVWDKQLQPEHASGLGEDGVTLLSLWGGELAPLLFRKPSETSGQSPFPHLRFPSDPCLQPACAWAVSTPSTTDLLCFISGTQLGFKSPNLKGSGKAQTHSPLEESLAALCLAPLCPRKAVTQPGRYPEFMVKHSQKQQPGDLPFVHTSVLCS